MVVLLNFGFLSKKTSDDINLLVGWTHGAEALGVLH
jgi:hypothetical protein